jgi:hypothetical protein
MYSRRWSVVTHIDCNQFGPIRKQQNNNHLLLLLLLLLFFFKKQQQQQQKSVFFSLSLSPSSPLQQWKLFKLLIKAIGGKSKPSGQRSRFHHHRAHCVLFKTATENIDQEHQIVRFLFPAQFIPTLSVGGQFGEFMEIKCKFVIGISPLTTRHTNYCLKKGVMTVFAKERKQRKGNNKKGRKKRENVSILEVSEGNINQVNSLEIPNESPRREKI